jgi:hypothetical protein
MKRRLISSPPDTVPAVSISSRQPRLSVPPASHSTARRRLVVLLVLLPALLTLPASAHGNGVVPPPTATLTFDDLPARTAVTNQYPSMTFGYPQNFGFTTGTVPADGVVDSSAACGPPLVEPFAATESAPQGGEISCGGENAGAGTFATLTDFADLVSVYVGDVSDSGDRFELDAYDSNRNLLASETVMSGQDGILTPISVAAPSYEIAYVALWLSGSTSHVIGTDNVSIWSGGAPPSITLLKPPDSFISQGTQRSQTISIVRHNGSNGPVTLSASDLPAGVGAQFSPAVLTGAAATSTLTLTATDSASLSSVQASLTATPGVGAGSTPSSVPLFLSVARPFDVQVLDGNGARSSATSVALAPCSTATVTVRTSIDPLFPGQVDLGLSTVGDTSDLTGLSLQKTVLDAAEAGNQDLKIVRGSARTTAGSFQLRIAATSGSFTEPPAVVTVDRVPPAIFSVNQWQGAFPSGVIPEADNPGTEVTIAGRGFCPGATVQFGNARAVVPAASVSADGSLIDVRVPPLATTGPVVVTSAGVSAVEQPTALQSGSFRVGSFRSDSGFRFSNYRLSSFTFGQVVELIGPDSAYYSTPWGQYDNPNADWFLNLANGAAAGQGVCFGISASLQKFQVRPEFESAYGLGAPSGPDSNLTDFIAVMHLDQFSSQFSGYQATELDTSNPINPNRTVQTVEQDLFSSVLQSGDLKYLPVVIIRTTAGGHALLAYNVEPDGTGGSFIDVYDPNIPFIARENTDTTGATHQQRAQTSRIDVHPNGSWTFPGLTVNGQAWSGNASTMYPAPWGTIPDPDATDPAQRPELPSAFSDLGGLSSSANAPTQQIQDAAGHTLYAPDGQVNTDPHTRIAHAVAVSDLTGSGMSAPPLILLPTNDSYVQTIRGTRAGSFSDEFYGGGLRGQLQANASIGTTDTVGWNPSAGSVSFSGAARTMPFTAELIADSRSGITHTMRLTTTTVAHGDDTITFARPHSTLSYTHNGPPVNLTLELSTAGPGLTPTAFVGPQIHIGRGDQLELNPTNWNRLGTTDVRVTVVHDGRRTTRLLRGSPTIARARILGLKIADGRRGQSSTITATAFLPHLDGGTQASVRFTVRRLRRTISTRTLLFAGGGGATRLRFAPRLGAGRYTVTVWITIITEHGGIIATGRSISRTHTLFVR